MSFFEKLTGEEEAEEEVILKTAEKEPTRQVRLDKKSKKAKAKPPATAERLQEDEEIENDEGTEEEEEDSKAKISVSLKKEIGSGPLKAAGQLVVDVYQTDDEFCIRAPIAGVEMADIEISIENEMLTIRGKRQEPDKEAKKSYFYQECYWGPFSRQIILPEDTDVQRTKAILHSGILIIKMPRIRKIKKKKVSIKANGTEEE